MHVLAPHPCSARPILADSLAALAWLVFLSGLAGLAGCATPVSTLQPAETLPRGDWHVGAALDLSLPVSRIGAAVDAAVDIAGKYSRDPGYVPTPEEQRTYLNAAVGLALNHPAVINDFMVRYGLRDGLEVGGRYAGNSFHLGAKLRLFDQPRWAPGWQGAVDVSYVHSSFSGLLFDVLSFLRIDDFSRRDVQVPLIFGRRLGRLGRVWLGPKYIYGQVHVDAALQNVDGTLAVDTSVHYLGGFGGLALGYAKVFFIAELTVMNMFADPVLLGQPTDVGGIMVMPAFGVMARF